jgi:hypothetical protein
LRIVGEKIKADTLNKVPDSSIVPSALLKSVEGTKMPLSPVSLDSTSYPAPANYTYQASGAHYFIFSVRRMESRVMGVKAGIGDFNHFVSDGDSLTTTLEPLSAGNAMIVVKSFKNAAAAKRYMAAFTAARTLVREYKASEYQIMIISAHNYRKLVSDGQIDPYEAFYKSHY